MPQRSVTCLAWMLRALRVGCLITAAMALAACGRCGDFLGASLGGSAACHSDPPPQ
jgi:hypothetical protein